MKRQIFLTIISCSFAMLLSAPAFAQETNSLESAARLQDPGALDAPGWNVNVNASHDAPSLTRFLGNHLNDSGASSVNVGVGAQINLNDKWFTHLGLASDNIFLGTVATAPIPAAIHTLHLNLDLGYHINDQWSVSGFLFPSIYRLDHVTDEDLGLAGGALAMFRQKKSLIWTFGLMVAPDTDFKVLPVGGVRWFIDEHSMLEVGFPRTRYTYRLDPHWSLYTGGDFTGTTFRTSDSLGTQTGSPQYNHALATYRDARLGAGVACRIYGGLRAELEGGYSVYRLIDYARIEQRVEFDPTPYVRLGLNLRF